MPLTAVTFGAVEIFDSQTRVSHKKWRKKRKAGESKENNEETINPRKKERGGHRNDNNNNKLKKIIIITKIIIIINKIIINNNWRQHFSFVVMAGVYLPNKMVVNCCVLFAVCSLLFPRFLRRFLPAFVCVCVLVYLCLRSIQIT